ncbi:MAG: homocysteine S-methyltransferase [Lactococcus hircilactis]
MTHHIQKAIKEGPILLDGAMGTELSKKGLATNNDLWSALALITSPEEIYAVHKSYFDAGAKIAITNTYQANLPAFEKHGIDKKDGKVLIKKAVALARQARDESNQEGFVAGSIGPYGAFLADGSEYTGAYHLSRAEYQAFHQPRLDALLEAGVDLIACETMPNFEEIKALCALIHRTSPSILYWVSFSLKDSHTLCDGTPLKKAITALAQESQIIAIGANCIEASLVDDAIAEFKAASHLPIVIYPNSGESYDPISKTWQTNATAFNLADLATKWVKSGVQLIGGCCRTSPDEIKTIAQNLEKLKAFETAIKKD